MLLYGLPANRVPDRKCEMIRVPPELWPGLESGLKTLGNFGVAWLQEVCKAFPGHSLLELQRSKPRLFPPLLQTYERTKSIQEYLVLQSNGDISVRDAVTLDDHRREGLRETELAEYRACRFQQGFASEGMLCNEPPIPLRVLDFLEARDLISLSLVSKSTHQAAHLLFKREEAVADRLRSNSVLCSTTRPHPQSQAQVLRGIRIGSLLHGTPETIPIRQGSPQILSCNNGHDTSNETLAWSYLGWNRWPNCWQTSMQRSSTRQFGTDGRHLGLGAGGRWVYVFEAPELQKLQWKISRWMACDEGFYDFETSTFLEIQLLVGTAISEGESVLWWDWYEFPQA